MTIFEAEHMNAQTGASSPISKPRATSRTPQVTMVVPSLNQSRYLDDALRSIAAQDVVTEIIVMDGGSTDDSLAVLQCWSGRLAYWYSGSDGGQAAAINNGIGHGSAPYVGWLNSDDMLEPGGLRSLIETLEADPAAPAAYGNVVNLKSNGVYSDVWVQPFSERALTLRCIISQPGTLIRRTAWEAVGGLDPNLQLAMDYDLWWRLYRRFGPLVHVPRQTAVNRMHPNTKTRNNRVAHYAEAIAVLRHHHGKVPAKWWMARPYSVWWKALAARLGKLKTAD
ncbi:GT2 family glycosyltransferase [Bradyrhizobium sp. JR4.1]|uniref:glycosyltransferase family 2 protein n=1 Tax=Bradyrhizobium sp. JR4.1 TaxID=3156372 RepID=UPI00339AF040